MCMEPPLPLQAPVALPRISPIISFTSTPFAMQWPCPRWVEAMRSFSPRWSMMAVAAASSPAYRCTNPGMSPRATSACRRSSNSRMVFIVRYAPSSASRPIENG